MNTQTQSRPVFLTLAVTLLAACDNPLTTPHRQPADPDPLDADVAPSFDGQALAYASGSYRIELLAKNDETARLSTEIMDAAAVWANILRQTELRDIQIPAGRKIPCHGINIDALSGTVDELLIIAWVRSIDGRGGTLASAGPCYVRRENDLPFVGALFLDEADVGRLSDDELDDLLVHQIGHILGIGPLWKIFNLLQSPSIDLPGLDTHFTGSLAVAAFDAAGGSDYRDGKVPVENRGGLGRADRHWRESVMGSELMTPVLQRGEKPLSAITIQSLADLRYQVDVSLADEYTLPAADQGAAQGDADGGRVIVLVGDVLMGPLVTVGPEEDMLRVPRM